VLKLKLLIPEVDGEITALGRVVWQRELTMDLLDTGIEFTEIDEQNNKKLLDFIKHTTGRTIERREYVRCDLKTKIKYSLMSSPEMESDCQGLMCVLGLKIMANEKLEKGTQLCIAFNLPEVESEIIVKCTVVAWVRQGEKDLFETGIEFLEISKEDKDKISSYIKNMLSKKK